MDLGTLVVSAISAAFGAAIAFLADYWNRRREAKLKEEAAINNLIIDLAGKRAFLTKAHSWDWGEGEIDRVTQSILDARDLVRDARLALRPRSKALPHLRQMTTTCNTFLQRKEDASDRQLQDTLRSVAVDMGQSVQSLHAVKPSRILNDAPGSAAL
jgi:hypothetical protein